MNKNNFFGHFWPKKWPKNCFFENLFLPIFFIYFSLIRCKKSEKANVGKYHNLKTLIFRPFSAISRPNIFFLTCGFLQKFRNDLFFRFKPFPDKTNAKFFFKVPKTSKNLIFGHIWPKKWPN